MFLLETIQRESVIRFPFLGNLTLNPPASFSVFASAFCPQYTAAGARRQSLF